MLEIGIRLQRSVKPIIQMLGIRIRLKVEVTDRTPLKDQGRQKWGRGVIEMLPKVKKISL